MVKISISTVCVSLQKAYSDPVDSLFDLYRTRAKEAVKVEAELTRDVLAEGLAVMAADVKSHKEKSHSAVKALQE